MRADRQSFMAASIAVAFTLTYALTHASGSTPAIALPPFDEVSMALERWDGFEAPELAPEVAEVLAADAYLHRYYVSEAGGVEMDVAYYTQRRVGASMHSPLNCLPGNGWTILDDRLLTLDTTAGPRQVRELVVKRNDAVFAMTYWYQNRGRVLSGEASTRLRLLADAVRRRPADVGLVRVMTPLSNEAGAGREGVAAFSALLIPELERVWGGEALW
jgi:EpsI family protein